MTEVLFILTIVFVAYVLYGIGKEPKTPSNSPVNPAKPEQPGPAVKPSTPQSASKTNKVKVTDVKPATAAASQPKPATGPQAAGKRGLKDPKTGDIATTYNNYRFTKRWIKEALVAEGLLDKVYKNDELNAAIDAKIKSAVMKLETLDKYRV